MKFVGDAGAKVQEGQKDIKQDQGVARAISVSVPLSSVRKETHSQFRSASRSLIPVCHGRIFLGSEASPIVCPSLPDESCSALIRTIVHIILKGVSTPEDALLAYDAGLQGIVLSNHGGRQLDTARSGLENLPPIIAALKTRGPWPNPNFSVFIDGGVRRATDVLKALAMGASAVGIGRGFLYAFASYGQEGVEKSFQILRVCIPRSISACLW